MGRETKIDLGSFTIASYLDERFVLAVSTSVTLRLPEQYASTVRTAIDLRDHIKQGNLWAARASACKIDLYLGFEAYAGSREGMQDTLLAAFEDCPVSPSFILLYEVQQLISAGMANTWASAPPRTYTGYNWFRRTNTGYNRAWRNNTGHNQVARTNTGYNRASFRNASHIPSAARLRALHIDHSGRRALRVHLHMALRIFVRLQENPHGYHWNRDCDSKYIVQDCYIEASIKKTPKIFRAKTTLGAGHDREAETTAGFRA